MSAPISEAMRRAFERLSRCCSRLVRRLASERMLLVGIAVCGLSIAVVLYVQLPMQSVRGGLRLAAGAHCPDAFDLLVTLTPGSAGTLAGQIQFSRLAIEPASTASTIRTSQCSEVWLRSSHAIQCLSLDAFYRTCLPIRPKRSSVLEYAIPKDSLKSFKGTLFVRFDTILARESLSERTLAVTVGIARKSGSPEGHVRIGINVPWRNAITLLLGLQTGTLENGSRLIFGPDPRQPVTSVRISFENRDRRNLAALIILLASTVLGVGASIVASRFVKGA